MTYPPMFQEHSTGNNGVAMGPDARAASAMRAFLTDFWDLRDGLRPECQFV